MLHDTAEIGDREISGGDGANLSATPRSLPPHAANTQETGAPARKPRRKRASDQSSTSDAAPASQHIGPASDGAAEGGGQSGDDPHKGLAPATPIVAQLVGLQHRRKFAIRQKNASVSSITAMIASTMGYRIDDETNRKAVFTRANTYRLAVEKDGGGHNLNGNQSLLALSVLHPFILASASTRQPWVELREAAEREMEALAKQLPTSTFAASVSGLGLLGLAVLHAEAGIPIGDYRTISGLWKRLGLAVFDGRRQRRMKDKAEAERHGYSPGRRAEVYAFISDSMFKQQWRGEKLWCQTCDAPRPYKLTAGMATCGKCHADEPAEHAHIIPAHAAGPYGEVYGRRKAATLPRVIATGNLPMTDPDKWTPKRCDNDARRVMSKALIRDLYRACHGLPPRGCAAHEDRGGDAPVEMAIATAETITSPPSPRM